jgi:hypothetical protein
MADPAALMWAIGDSGPLFEIGRLLHQSGFDGRFDDEWLP